MKNKINNKKYEVTPEKSRVTFFASGKKDEVTPEKSRVTFFASGKKGINEVGVGIIFMAILLLLGGIFIDSDSSSNSKQKYLEDKEINGVGDEYLFFLNETEIGKQQKVTTSYSNIILGSKPEYNVVYLGNNFILNANPFTSNTYSFKVNFEKPEDVNNYLIYFDPVRISGENQVIIRVDGEIVSKNSARKSDLPIRVYNKLKNNSVVISFEIEKPRWYQLFNWNKFEVNELKIVEERQDKNNMNRNFAFNVEQEFLERVYIDVLVECDVLKEVSDSLEIKINGQTISNENPNCISRNSKITAEIPKEILKVENNTLNLETLGEYKISYNINRVYFNDKETYKFNINSFNSVIDVFIYGEFDVDALDIKLNNKILSVNKNEIQSIIRHLKYGTNEITILTKPVEIEELSIEQDRVGYN